MALSGWESIFPLPLPQGCWGGAWGQAGLVRHHQGPRVVREAMPPNALSCPRRAPRGAAFACLLVTVLLSASPVSPASLVMLHTSLHSHIATGSYFPHHPAGDPRAEPGELPERSPVPQRGAQQPETQPEAGDTPSPFRASPGTSPDPQGAHPALCLSFPPRSISKTRLGDFFF